MLTRRVKIDWLRFQFKSSSPYQLPVIKSILNLPFEKVDRAAETFDSCNEEEVAKLPDRSFIALNKVWHEAHEFQGSLIGVLYASVDSEFSLYFVDLNGSTIDGTIEGFKSIFKLITFAYSQENFLANRIDIALDFLAASPRLSARSWELFVFDGFLAFYKSVRRISNMGQGEFVGSTVYLGSRQSERFVRIYDKNIDDIDYDRLEIEFKRGQALWVMKSIAEDFSVNQDVDVLIEFLNGVACGQICFLGSRSDVDFFEDYKCGAIEVPPTSLHLDIERSIAFVRRHSATFAMLQEFMGDFYEKFMADNVSSGKFKLRYRHRAMIRNARSLGVDVSKLLAVLLLFLLPSYSAFAAICTPQQSLQSQMVQKFPIDIALPNPSEQAYLNSIGDGCFQLNSGLNFDRICLPGMIVNSLRPFIIVGLGIKFIFSN
jgi:hypothetical protein